MITERASKGWRLAVIIALAVAACSPGAAPMPIERGRYAVSVDGKPVDFPNGKTLCLTSGDDEATIEKLAELPFKRFTYCTHGGVKHAGAAFRGDLTCNANVAIGMSVDYTGTITSGDVSIDAVMKPMALDESTHQTFKVRAMRTGPC